MQAAEAQQQENVNSILVSASKLKQKLVDLLTMVEFQVWVPLTCNFTFSLSVKLAIGQNTSASWAFAPQN